MNKVILIILLFISTISIAQYAPAAGQSGSTAIYRDSNVFVSWASNASITRGWVNAQDTSLGIATYGVDNNAVGIADNSTVSLGDGGLAIISFANTIVDGPSWDFAVFENSFDDFFLELAFVEVSSDGQYFVRFPSHSLTQIDSQITTFGTLEATKINNLAGKYKGGYGTPFDLSELQGNANLDLQNINFIRIIDVVGSIDSTIASYDSNGNIINDPFPTPFPSSGFDLDAIGVINQNVGFSKLNTKSDVSIFPNPCKDFVYIKTNTNTKIQIFNMLSQLYVNIDIKGGLNKINTSSLPKGVYVVNLIFNKNRICKKLIIK